MIVNDLIKVGMADYKVAKAPSTLISYGLGSCIGIAVYDPTSKVGGLLHIMLSDSAQAQAKNNLAKFADTGIPLLVREVIAAGGVKRRLVAKMAGGAQMFAFRNASSIMQVGERNAQVSKEILQSLGIPIVAEDTGGSCGRTVFIDLNNGDYFVRTIEKGERKI